jgi:hypothetical protein
MSSSPRVVEPPICDYCGEWIDEPDQACPAREEGVCAP